MKLQASSLAEVLIVLGIISTTIIASTSLVINSLVTVRENEISDAANGLLVQTVEIIKSPSNIYVSDNIFTSGSVGQTYYFRLKEGSNSSASFLEYISGGSPINTCTASSPYYKSLNLNNNTSVNSCLQIQIKPVKANTKVNYEITALIVYNIRSDTQIRYLRAYRTESFIEV